MQGSCREDTVPARAEGGGCLRGKSCLAAEHPGNLKKLRARENSIRFIRNGTSGEKNVTGGTARQIAGL